MKTIQIQIPDGYEIDNFDPKKGEVKFKKIPKDIKSRLKTMDDVYSYHGINKEEFEKDFENLTTDEIGYRKVKLIVSAYNDNEKPDYSNTDQRKYFPRFHRSASGGFSYYGYGTWTSGSDVGVRLEFLSYENLLDAVEKFLPEYEQFLT